MTRGTSDWEVDYSKLFVETESRYHANLMADVAFAGLPPSAGAVERVEAATRLLKEFEIFQDMLTEREESPRDPVDLPVAINHLGESVDGFFHLDQSPWHAIFHRNGRKRITTGTRIFNARDWPEDL